MHLAHNKFRSSNWLFSCMKTYKPSPLTATGHNLGVRLMKNLAMIFLLTICAQPAFAGVCEQALDSHLRDEYEAKQWEYGGVALTDENKVQSIIENSGELNDDGRSAIRM